MINDIMDELQKAGKFAYDKASNAKDVVKLEFEISSVRNKIENCYKEVGRLTYDGMRNETDNSAPVNVLTAQIDNLKAQLAQLYEKTRAAKDSFKNRGDI